MKLNLGQIADWIGVEGDIDTTLEATGYSIDSRTISAGDLFFAVRGEHMDGHDYVEAALANGAVGAVVSLRWLIPAGVDSTRLLLVPDENDHQNDGVLAALQQLAAKVRQAWGGRVIGVTGSAGKTTTKEAIATVLSAAFHVLKSQGNFNNGFGLPLQLLKLEPQHEVAVIEMGMNHAGEIRALAEIAKPNWAVVSNVAPVHLEHFPDGIKGIAAAKYELVESLPPDGIAVLNADDEFVRTFGADMGDRAVFYGTSVGANVRATHIKEVGAEGTEFQVEVKGQSAAVKLHLLGRHNVMNALAAIAVGFRSGMPLDQCVSALGTLRASDRRGEVTSWNGVAIINDCYNSNPRALDAMVDALMAIPAQRHIVIAGEMLELGPDAERLHHLSGESMAQKGVSLVVGVRGFACAIADGAKDGGVESLFFETPAQAGHWMKANLLPQDAVLLKASRGVRLEGAVKVLENDKG